MTSTLKELRARHSELGLGNGRKLERDALEARIAAQLIHNDKQLAYEIARQERRAAEDAAQDARLQEREAAKARRAAGNLNDADDADWAREIRKANYTIESYGVTRDKFIQRLMEYPSDALSWSVSLFEAAADFELAQNILHYYAEGLSHEDLKKQMLEDVISKARYSANKSTSPTSNLMADCHLQAKAKIISN